MSPMKPLASAWLAMFCLVGFAILAISVQVSGALIRFDFAQTERFFHFASTTPGVWDFFRRVTDLGAGTPLTVFAIAVVAWVILERQYRLALLVAAVMFLNDRSIGLLKDFFGRERPPFITVPMNPSFPSGHMQGSMVVYGLTIYLAFLRWPTSRFRWVAGGALALLTLLIGISRMMLGVHYFTDVFGGMLIGMAWIGATMAIVERSRERLNPPTSTRGEAAPQS